MIRGMCKTEMAEIFIWIQIWNNEQEIGTFVFDVHRIK